MVTLKKYEKKKDEEIKQLKAIYLITKNKIVINNKYIV